MSVIIQAVARLWRGLREPRMVPVPREIRRAASRNHARFVIFR
jgi:hypothetical protein